MVKFTWWDQIEVVGLVKFVSGGDQSNLKCLAYVTLPLRSQILPTEGFKGTVSVVGLLSFIQ